MNNRILIVDDDTDLADTIKTYLDAKGNFNIQLESNGMNTLQKTISFRPDLMLLDINIPGINGYKICEMIRSHKGLKFTKIIFISGKATIDDRLKGYSVGANDYVVKPFDLDELTAKTKVFLRLKYIEELNEIKDNVLKAISHETRNPLNVILGFSEIICETSAARPECGKCAKLARLINQGGHQLFDYTQKTALLCSLKGGVKPTMEETDMLELLRQTVKNDIITSEQCKVKLSSPVKKKIFIQGDPSLLPKAFLFALQYAAKNCSRNKKITVLVKPEKNSYTVIISGIKRPENMAHPEDMFDELISFDLDSKGYGLNLPLARLIARVHNGEVSAHFSKNNMRLIFYLYPQSSRK